MMASNYNLREELTCSFCRNLYTDPVSLRCGHNFCRSCIMGVLDTQDGSGGYSCPECRTEYLERPALEKNRKLANIVEHFLSSQAIIEKTEIFCTNCIKSPVPAVKSCLHCEISLCDDHLTVHNKTMVHMLTEPTGSFGNKKCSIHKKVLEYYCVEDEASVCVSCCLDGDHKGHQVERLNEATEKKKLSKYLDELNTQKAEIQTRVQNVLEHQRNIQEKASTKRQNVSKFFMDIKEQLETAEKKALSEVSRQEEKILTQLSLMIRKLEKEEEELSKKIRHLEEMCHVTDPIRPKKMKMGDNSDVYLSNIKVQDNRTDPNTVQESGQGGSIIDNRMVAEEGPVSDLQEMADNLDEVLISMTLHRSMRDIFSNVTSQLGFHVPDILLDVDTAGTFVKLSEDLKTATESREKQDRPQSAGRFLSYTQVLSRCGFSSGRHYWEVAWNQIGDSNIGVTYPSITKRGKHSGIADNDKSWCLIMFNATCKASHNSIQQILNVEPTCPTLGVFLDYEAGRLSFYELCDPIRHLHTFTASFTEPLHVAFYMNNGASITIRS